LVNTLPDNINIFEGEGLPDISYKEYAHQKNLGKEYENIIENIAGDQGAAASHLSVYGNNKDEENIITSSGVNVNGSSGYNNQYKNDNNHSIISKSISTQMLFYPIIKIFCLTNINW
jgi:hypothetical protein